MTAPFDPALRALLEGAFRAAVDAADPDQVLAAALPPPPKGRTVVVGAGKAAGQMAAALEAAWPGPLEGVVVTRYGHAEGIALQHVALREAAHPVPDTAGLAATREIMAAVAGLAPEDLVIALISGGGSALLCQPLAGLELAEKQALTRALLASGATIGEMNAVRQRLSAVKGGRLAALAAPARVVTLYVSDVPGDAVEIVASGPTVPPIRPVESADRILARYGITPSPAIAAALASAGSHPPEVCGTEARMIASPRQSLEAAAEWLAARGWATRVLSDRIEGEAREIGKALSAIADYARDAGRVAILSGGETTVTLRGTGGRGGRNAECALGAALALRGTAGIAGLCADTDGIDGTETNAGAIFDGATAARMQAAGCDPFAALAANDAYGAFLSCDQLVTTGPTGTNVNDFRLFLVDPDRA